MKNDKHLGLIILALGITGILLTMQIPVKTFTDDPGPRVFPYFRKHNFCNQRPWG